MRIDQVMIKSMLGNEMAGIYAAAAKLSEFWYFIPGLIVASVNTALINARKTSIENYDARMRKLYFFLFWLSFSIALITTLFAKEILLILLGKSYILATIPLKIYVWGGIANSIGGAFAAYLIIENYTKMFAATTALGALINIGLNLFLIPHFGINGAALATAISYSVAILAMYFFKKTRKQIRLIASAIIPSL